jgi:hypothetical protein
VTKEIAVTDRPIAVWGHQEITADGIVTCIGGQVDYATITAFVDQLLVAEAAATPPTPVLVDLTNIEFLGSCALSSSLVLTPASTSYPPSNRP